VAPAGVAVTVEADVHGPRDATFTTIAPIDLTQMFTGFGPLPAVAATRDQTGGWDHVGATRTVELADGSEAREEITAYEAPAHFAYRLQGFTGPLRFLVSHADGAWWFSDDGAGATHVRWTYIFQPRGGRGLLVSTVVAPLWRAYARRALDRAVRACARPPVQAAPQRPG
jgi:hypothetical protein